MQRVLGLLLSTYLSKLTLLFGLLLFGALADANAAIPKRVTRVLEQKIVPAHRSGNLLAVKPLLVNLVEKLSDEHFASANEFLSKRDAPSLDKLLAGVRETEVVALRVSPNISPDEAARILGALNERIRTLAALVEAALNDRGTGLVGRDSRSDNERRGANQHVNTNEQLQALQKQLKRIDTAELHHQVAQQLTQLAGRIAAMINRDASNNLNSTTLSKLREQAARLRIAAVSRATDVIRDSQDFSARLRAAHIVDFEGQQLLAYLRKSRDSSNTESRRVSQNNRRGDLAAPQTIAAIRASVDYARETAGDLTSKSRLLFSGMDWWLRGRYGIGPFADGLSKPVPSSSEEPRDRLPVPLYMPLFDLDQTEVASPKFARRHHFVWAVQESQITLPSSVRTPRTTTPLFFSEANERSREFTRAVGSGWPQAASSEPTTAAREVQQIVGYIEYGMALRKFDLLLSSLTDAERVAVSDFVADHPAFTLRIRTPPNSLRQLASEQQPPPSAAEQAAQNGTRQGLDWVMALARIEYASILATMTSDSDPFVSAKPTQYELPAYKALLNEGVRTHYVAMQRESKLRPIEELASGDPIVLAYSRRLGLARKMIRAYAKSGASTLSPAEFRELATWKYGLDQMHADLLSGVRRRLGRFDAQN